MNQTYSVRPAKPSELPSVASLWVDYLPELYQDKHQQDVLDAKASRQRWLEEHYQKNSDIVTLIHNHKGAVYGFYILIPLNNYGYQRIINVAQHKPTDHKPTDDLISHQSRWIDTNDSSATFNHCKSVWVAMLAGKNIYAQGKTTSIMMNQVKNLIPLGHIKSILARARTQAGQRIMSRYGFSPIGDSGIAEADINKE